MITGGCLCGAVRYKADAYEKDYRICHCTACRKQSGHFWSATEVPLAAFRLTEERGLKWFKSSDFATRGFCGDCGSSLFYRLNDGDTIEVAPGSMDGRTGLRLTGHIFVADKGDYYDLNDGLPQWDASS